MADTLYGLQEATENILDITPGSDRTVLFQNNLLILIGVSDKTPDPQPWSGTSIWRHKKTGTCVASQGIVYYRGPETLDHFDLAFLVENRYNRLLLFRENVLHRVETGFGAGDQARLTQTFFFQTQHYI